MEQPTDTGIGRAVKNTLASHDREEQEKALLESVPTIQTAAVSPKTFIPAQLLQVPPPIEQQPTAAMQQPMSVPATTAPVSVLYNDNEFDTEAFLQAATAAFFARYAYMPDTLVISHLRRMTLPETSWFQFVDEPEPIVIRSPGDQELGTTVPVTADIAWDTVLVLRLSETPTLHHHPIL